MPLISRVWGRIGTKLYLALGCAVFLTLISGAVGVWHFEQSGHHAYRVRDQSVPVLEAAWQVYGHAQILGRIGMVEERHAADSNAHVNETLAQVEKGLARVYEVPALAPAADRVSSSTAAVAGRVQDAIMGRELLEQSARRVAEVTTQLDLAASAHPGLLNALSITRAALRAEDHENLERLRSDLAEAMERAQRIPEDYSQLFHRVLEVKSSHLHWRESVAQSEAALVQANETMDDDLEYLLTQSRRQSHGILTASVRNFERGRIILIAISATSVLAGAAVSWLWVGRRLLRRLHRLTARMRGMADGNLETPVPEMGHDEIGQLAQALELFRRNSLEAQRLQLVESLYRQLQQASEENARMQARLVAQEKLAALGELVAGVAHEISNPLNFITNFSKNSLSLYGELAEMLEKYRERLSEDDASLLDELTGEITGALNRVSYNGGRALAIVRRMQSLSTTTAVPTPVRLNNVLQQAVNQGCQAFTGENPEFETSIEYRLSEDIGETMLMERDFVEAVVNLVTNACYAMAEKKNSEGEDYTPTLTVTSDLDGEIIDIRIRDNGTGVAESVRDRIFNPFVTTQEGSTMGAGLGLTIASDIVRRHDGGELTLETGAGVFTEFSLKLRLRTGDDAPEVHAGDRPARDESATGPGASLRARAEAILRPPS